MHEMSIAMSIIDIATEQAKKEKAKVVKELELDIGTMAGIEFESLNFAMQTAIKNTILEKANIKINKIQAIAKCLDCEAEFEADQLFAKCPNCESQTTFLKIGKELKVKSILID